MAMLYQEDPNLERRRQLAQAMMARGQQQGPVQHWTQGADRIANSLIGAYQNKKANEEADLKREKAMAELSAVLSGNPGVQELNKPGGMVSDMGQPQGSEGDQLVQVLSGINPEAALQLRLNQMQQKNAPANVPAGLREFQGLTQGMSPEDVQKARRIALGLEGRASSAGGQTFRMRGADGRERVFRFDPGTMDLDVFDGRRWTPAGRDDRAIFTGGGGAAGGRGQAEPPRGGGSDSELFVSRSPEEQSRITAESTPPEGMKFQTDPNTGEKTLVPIPGGPVDRDIEQEQRKLQDRQRNTNLAANTVVQDLGRLREHINKHPNTAVGPATALQPKRFGTPAHLTKQFVDSVKSNISIDRLQAMRESSPTGGALGQVPVQQQEYLMQLLGSLDMEQPRHVMEDNVARIQNIYLDIIHGTNQGPERQPLSFDNLGRRVEGGVPWQGDPLIMEAEQRGASGQSSNQEPSIEDLVNQYAQ